jgi:hypothetical protein
VTDKGRIRFYFFLDNYDDNDNDSDYNDDRDGDDNDNDFDDDMMIVNLITFIQF